MSPTPTTRLAPSPTGALHLGNARTFLVNWALARQGGWRVRMRIEDLDGPRVKPGAAEQAIEDLVWLGLDWDGGICTQRSDLSPYREALRSLHERGRIYPCTCTRREIERAQSAPHEDDGELRYPGTCRPLAGERAAWSVPLEDVAVDAGDAAGADAAWRLVVPDEPVAFDDELHGRQTVNVQAQVGDFVVATKAGLPAYQLAVVVDDARQGVTEVVRGDDLLSSAARQRLLYDLLDLAPRPRYWHLPLVVGPDGRRLAKRHGDTRIATYRAQGVPAARIVGLLAAWSGVIDEPAPMAAAEFADRFSLDRLPRERVTFTDDDDAWLRAT